MSKFTGILLILVAFVVTACSSVVEEPEGSGNFLELKVQVVSSMPDGEAINSLIIYNEDGEPIDTMNNFVDRFQVFMFPPGDYGVRVLTFTDAGSVDVRRDVSLFSDESITIDASSRIVSNVNTYKNSSEEFSVFLSFPLWLDDTYMDDPSVGLSNAEFHLVGEPFLLTGVDPRGLDDEVVTEDGNMTIHFSPQNSVVLTRGFAVLSFSRPFSTCGRIGYVNAFWESGTSTVQEKAWTEVPCKG